MEKTKQDFSKFGKDFQENLCHLILDDRPFADQIFEVLFQSIYDEVDMVEINNKKNDYGINLFFTLKLVDWINLEEKNQDKID